ncbi:MAG: PLP-dependent transferase [Calditrichaeota bacterium]|nr:PLP-dependent transferase [Candidatus Cloacimonadota bacterium]MCB1046425.1 PLP-dependent transferase [Calditrichota bacterium]MCB9474204.1 PLP-dependent transferase [Candidatus Delongbacteria bacterium]
MNKATRCIHGISKQTGRGLVNPIQPSTAYRYLDDDQLMYPRYFNTDDQRSVIGRLAALEGAEDGLLFSSGMAAITTCLLALLDPGDGVVIQEGVYGGTSGFGQGELARLGMQVRFCPGTPADVERALDVNTRVLMVESPTNPRLDVVDLRAIATLARSRGVLAVIDNTFATPVNQNPLELGFDLVIHSGTKYLGGHSDLSCGVVLGDSQLIARVMGKARNYGGNLNALDCHLLERSLKTLFVRVEAQNRTAGVLAAFLADHRAIKAVHYPGLESHPGHALARGQMSGFGGMLSFELENRRDPMAFMRSLRLIVPALSLGGVDTTICQPAATSHKGLDPAERRRLGIGDGLLRLSVGLEHEDDLIHDLLEALGQ